MALTDKQVNQLFNDVYAGRVTQRKLPKAYYNDFVSQLDSDIKKGFGVKKVTDKTKNLKPISEMADNARLFAGGKTYHLTRELADAKKNTKSRAEFKAEAQKIYDKYNRWGEAERNTMVSSAQASKLWQDIEKDKALFPKLRYSTIGDACQICLPLNGIVAPVDSVIWKTAFVPNHYNCLCTLTKETSSVRTTNTAKLQQLSHHLDQVMDDTFKNNVGQTGEAFPRHPYYEVAKKDVALARRNFDLPFPDIKNELDLNDIYEQIQVRFDADELSEVGNTDVEGDSEQRHEILSELV